jgi:hypothetical protein
VYGIAGISALASDALGSGKYANFFIVTNGGSVQTGSPGEISDLHYFLPFTYKPLDLKLTLTFSMRDKARQIQIGGIAMNDENRQLTAETKQRIRGTILALLMAGSGTTQTQAQTEPITTNAENKTITTQQKFYCNRNALNPPERAHHKELTDKIIAVRRGTVETEKGYEFQYSPSRISLAELADWVAAEGKCCQFFDFHIDLERRGSLLCLRLTGDEGIKPFIRAEFQVPAR